MQRRLWTVPLLFVFLIFACEDDDTTMSGVVDSGSSITSDGSTPTADADTEADAGIERDTGTEEDAATQEDATTQEDTGAQQDTGFEEDAGPSDAGFPPTTRVRVVHASPNTGVVDVRPAGGASFVEDLDYLEASGYVVLPSGMATVEVVLDDSGTVALSQMLTLPPDATVTVVAAGFAGSTDPSERLRLLSFEENFPVPGADEVIAQVVHAAPNAPPVDLDLDLDGTADATDLARFTALPSTTALDTTTPIRIDVLAAGGPSVSTFTIEGLTSGETIFAIATGSVAATVRADDAFGLLAVLPPETPTADTSPTVFVEQDPRLYLLHAAIDLGSAATADLFVDADELVADVEFGDLIGPLQVSPTTGATIVDFFATAPGNTRPSGVPVHSASFSAVSAGERYLLVAYGQGTSTTDPLEIGVILEAMAANASFPTVVGFHGAPDANSMVDIFTSDTAPPPPPTVAFTSLGTLTYGTATNPTGAVLNRVGNSYYGVSDVGTSDIDAVFAPLDGQAGDRFFVAAGGVVQGANVLAGLPLVRLFAVEVRDDRPWTLSTLVYIFPPIGL